MAFILSKKQAFIFAVDNINQLSYKRFWKYLTFEEQTFAAHFRTLRLQTNYVIAHGLLRKIMSYFCDKSPSSIEFSYNSYSKPSLKDSQIKFNLSHSGNAIYYIVALGNEVGIDIQYHEENIYLSEIINSVFSETEMLYFLRLNESQKRLFFFDIWVKKEALLKADGRGLSYELNRIDLLAPNVQDTFLLPNEDLQNSKEFYYSTLATKTNYSCAFAIEGKRDYDLVITRCDFIKT